MDVWKSLSCLARSKKFSDTFRLVRKEQGGVLRKGSGGEGPYTCLDLT